MPKVAIKRCRAYEDERVYSAVREAVGLLGGINSFIKKGERILIKPNLLAGKPVEAAVTTHPSVVKAAIRLVRDAGATPIVGDSPGIGSAPKVAEKCGVANACRELGVELLDLKELVVVENPGGHTFKRLEVAKEALGVDGIVNLPKLKTHAQMYLTLSVKNLFGCVPGKRKPQWHFTAGVDCLSFASMLLDLCLFLKPRLTVVDGVIGMEGNGPGNGEPRELGLIVAGADCVAIDTVIAGIVGASSHDVPILRAAIARGLSGAEPGNIDVMGEAIKDVRVRNFRFPPLISTNFTEKLPRFLDSSIRKALTSRPHVEDKTCTLCGICAEVCPAGVMEKKGRIEIDYERCIRCYCCQEMCPEGAITPREGWLKSLLGI